MRVDCIILIAFSVLLLASCTHRNKNKLSILFDHVDNLEIGSKVNMKGIVIGEVTAIEFFRDSVLVDIYYTGVKIPVDSKFIINSPLVSAAYLAIEPSNNITFLASKDTVNGYYLKKGLLDDMVSDSTKKENIQKSLDKIGEGIKELIKASRDTAKQRK
jgi:ABC-type transporter Mla subunit MlaD